MNRRDFLKTAGGSSGLMFSLPLLSQPGAQPDPTVLIPADKGYDAAALAALRSRGQRRVYTGEQRRAIGMPIGGICAGQVYLLGDGRLGGWHVDGRLNPTGYGSENYTPRAHARELLQHFTITAEDADAPRSAVLAEPPDGPYDAIEFVGEYPVAQVRYRAAPPTAAPPVDVTLTAYSPFIPLDADDSALPCTVMRFTLRNSGPNAVRGRLEGVLENGVERDAVGGIGAPLLRNRVVREPGLTAVLMDAVRAEPDPLQPPRPERLLRDFNGPDYGDWKAQGAAMGTGPSRGTTPRQNPVTGFEGAGLVNTYADDDDLTGSLTSPPFTIDRNYLVFLIGGGRHKGTTCINLRLGRARPGRTRGRDRDRR